MSKRDRAWHTNMARANVATPYNAMWPCMCGIPFIYFCGFVGATWSPFVIYKVPTFVLVEEVGLEKAMEITTQLLKDLSSKQLF